MTTKVRSQHHLQLNERIIRANVVNTVWNFVAIVNTSSIIIIIVVIKNKKTFLLSQLMVEHKLACKLLCWNMETIGRTCSRDKSIFGQCSFRSNVILKRACERRHCVFELWCDVND